MTASVAPGSIQIEAFELFRALRHAANPSESLGEPSFAGSLLYSGELTGDNGSGRAIVVAGNVAGCATLAATDDSAAPKQAIRDGVIDFAVTSLDEALRILKNEIRKGEPVAVCVGIAPAAVEEEMIERGVLPDFVFAGAARDPAQFGKSAREVRQTAPAGGYASLAWQVLQAPARWMPKLDALAIGCLASDEWAQRWVRLAPRYCGRTALSQRALSCEIEAAKQIVARFKDAIEEGNISAEVAVSLREGGEVTDFRFPMRASL